MQIRGVCYLNLSGINKFKYERKTKWILEVAVKWFVIYRSQLTIEVNNREKNSKRTAFRIEWTWDVKN